MSELVLKTKTRLNAVMFAMLVEEMVSGPCTIPGLIEATGLHHKTIRGALKALHDRNLAHVSGYDKDCRGRAIVPVWSFGEGRDAKRKPKSHAELSRAYRSRRAAADLAVALTG